MAILDDIKAIKYITDTSQDAVLNIYIRRATVAIRQYLNIPNVQVLDKYKMKICNPVTEIFPNTDTYTVTDDGTTTRVLADDIQSTFPDAVIQIVLEILNRQGDEGISKSFVGREMQSVYELGMSESAKGLLPLPFATTINTFAISDYYGNGNLDDDYYDDY
jgi:hypothetical protein